MTIRKYNKSCFNLGPFFHLGNSKKIKSHAEKFSTLLFEAIQRENTDNSLAIFFSLFLAALLNSAERQQSLPSTDSYLCFPLLCAQKYLTLMLINW